MHIEKERLFIMRERPLYIFNKCLYVKNTTEYNNKKYIKHIFLDECLFPDVFSQLLFTYMNIHVCVCTLQNDGEM